MVAGFAGRLDLSHAKYTFSVITLGGSSGTSALRQLESILRKRQDHGLDAGFSVTMPGNYILMYSSPSGKKQEEILAKADEQIAGILGPVTRCEKRALPSSLIFHLLHTLIYPWFTSHVHTDDRKFSVNDKCTSCGTCAAICPAGNIEMVQGQSGMETPLRTLLWVHPPLPGAGHPGRPRTGKTAAIPEPVRIHR